MIMRNSILAALLLVPALADAQQKVDIRRAATPDVSVRLSGAFSSLRVVAWPVDSIALTGAVGAGNSVQGGPLNFTGPVTGMKFFVEGTSDANVAANRLELRVPRNARVWVKTGSADVDCEGVGGGLDINIIGGSVRVTGKPRELLVEAMDGGITFRGYADYARLKTATGNIVLDQAGGEDLSLVTVSGSIRVSNGQRTFQRLRMESVTGAITYAGIIPERSDVRVDSHSGAIELRLLKGSGVEVDVATMTGAIENAWTSRRPIAGREGRGMELATSSGTGAARIQVRSFKGNVRLTGK